MTPENLQYSPAARLRGDDADEFGSATDGALDLFN